LEELSNQGSWVWVMSIVSIGRAIKLRKLTSIFVWPYQVSRRIGPAMHEIVLPPHLTNFHNVFHVS